MTEYEALYLSILQNALEYAAIDGYNACIFDPIFNLKRNRVTAEVCKSMLRSGHSSGITDKMAGWLSQRQNPDGSWDEIHARYAKPSAMETAFEAEALLLWNIKNRSDRFDACLQKARDYVLRTEISPGFFKKSESYLADHLNVDASCGAFLGLYGKVYDDEASLEAARRAAFNCIRNQWDDGAYPYTTKEGGSPYKYPLDVPCIHYQGVTLYYLIKIQKYVRDGELDRSIRKGIEWLAGCQEADGRFDWSKSGQMFVYYVSGAYAFAIPAFLYAGREENARKSAKILSANIDGIAWRWQTDPLYTFPLDIGTTMKSAMLGNFPPGHRMFRFGYGLYKQFARRKYSRTIDDKLFKVLTKTLNIKTSTIEPSSNYPDLFMTSEILDCLSFTMECAT